jgi:hypothetical protein
MAKIVIVIEDIPDQKVKITSVPSIELMLKMDNSGEDLTPANGYAFFILNKVREFSKLQAELGSKKQIITL